MSNSEYRILNYWDNNNDLYVNYVVENLKNNQKANVVNIFAVSDLDCDYFNALQDEIDDAVYKLIKNHSGWEFKISRVSDLSPLLRDIYDCVCESDANMCHIDYDDWKELKEEIGYTENDFNNLKDEIDMYNLNDFLVLDDGEYKICGYGGLQCCFNDDRATRWVFTNDR